MKAQQQTMFETKVSNFDDFSYRTQNKHEEKRASLMELNDEFELRQKTC